MTKVQHHEDDAENCPLMQQHNKSQIRPVKKFALEGENDFLNFARTWRWICNTEIEALSMVVRGAA